MIRAKLQVRALVLAWAASLAPAVWALPDDAAVRAILNERIAQKRGVGFAAVLFDAKGARIVTAGLTREGGPPIAPDTEFEIGSLTKTFTSLLLADTVVRGDATLDDPVTKYLPGVGPALTHEGKTVTLVNLATHSSGLPPLPSNLGTANPADPYADYDAAKLLAYLGGADVLERTPGSEYAYSNLGAGLLGYALTARLGGYEKTLRERVLVPLKMDDTAIKLSPAQERRFASGHDPQLQQVAPWRLDALAGAGGLRSTPSDMAKYLQAAAVPGSTPLAEAFKLAEQPRMDVGASGLRVGLAWHVINRGARGIVWHNGRTGGFASMMAFDPAAGEGVIVLSNASIGVDDLALHILEPAIPLSLPPKQRVIGKVDPATRDRIAGRYELARDFVLTVRRDGDRVFAQATGQGELEIFPESDYEYFYKAVDAQLSFVRDSDDRVSGVVLHQGGRNMNAKRMQ